MKRLFKLAVLAVPLVAFNCSSPPVEPEDDEDLGTAALALDEGEIEPFMTTSFDIASRTLSGYDADLNPYTGVFVETSRFLRARVENYIPGDPCRELAIAYNIARVNGGDALFNAISNYVGCNARVRLSSDGQIRAFTPIADPPPPLPDDDCDDHKGKGKHKHPKHKGKGHCIHGKGYGFGHDHHGDDCD